MKATYPMINEIFKTLPIGYYLGRRIDIELSETSNSSYFNPSEDNIVISYIMIERALLNLPDNLSKIDIEELVRGLVYHEVSHVILTPSNLKYEYNTHDNKIINIVEDERIETICNFYMRVNFKKNIKIINNYHGEDPRDAESAFYYFIRYHKSTEKWLNRLHDLFVYYYNITSEYSTTNSSKVHAYREAILKLYRDFINEYEKENQEDQNDQHDENDNNDENENNNDESEDTENEEEDDEDESEDDEDSIDDTESEDDTDDINDSTSNNSDSSDDSDDSEENTKDTNNTTISDDTKDLDENNEIEEEVSIFDEFEDEDESVDFSDLAMKKETFKRFASKLIGVYHDPAMEQMFKEIIDEKLKANKNNGSAINSYSGRFNYRSVGTRNDYKWWSQENRIGHIRQYSKVHFNLFIDNSGSFKNNDYRTNVLIKTLDRLQINDFSFDIITINTTIDEWEDHSKVFQSSDGNILTPQIGEVIRRHTKPDANNYNIVLFDGDAHSDERYHHSTTYNVTKPFKYFNSTNTILITDEQNRAYIEHDGCEKAKIKYLSNKDYCSVFIEEIGNLLRKCI